MTGDKIAVTTYSSLFNTAPAFADPDAIILDDAHAAENYVASMWSLEVPAGDTPMRPLYDAIVGLLRDRVTPVSYARLSGFWSSSADATWVDKLPSSALRAIENDLSAILDAHEDISKHVRFTWPLLRGHLAACHVYLASRSILIRPLIPPTWSHAPFEGAKHRLYMSATLGAGGDLERLTGRARIHRMPTPERFKGTGVGRRLFLFPGMSLTDDGSAKLRRELRGRAGRAVVLTPDDARAKAIRSEFEACDVRVFDAAAIETSKAEFVQSANAVAVMAGRFDGIDFPRDECRLLCLEGLPSATNAQERFLVAGMGAIALLRDRIQTRILQAAGRCTRALEDRSTVLVMGHELGGFLGDSRNWRHIHPIVQAELAFGVEQSKEVTAAKFIELFDAFMLNEEEWDEANQEIVEQARACGQEPMPGMADLAEAVPHEVAYQKALWRADPAEALEHARPGVRLPDGAGTARLSGAVALSRRLSRQGGRQPHRGAGAVRHGQERGARTCRGSPNSQPRPARTQAVPRTRRRRRRSSSKSSVFERRMIALGAAQDKRFEKEAAEILQGLNDTEAFEEAQRRLGELLGFTAGNAKADAAPDPWWLGVHEGLVFEDHAKGTSSTVFGAEKARQAAGHPNWLRAEVAETVDMKLHVVIVTPCTRAGSGARPQLGDVRLWGSDDFRAWAAEAIATLRRLKAQLPGGGGDLDWRARAASCLAAERLTLGGILARVPLAVETFDFETA